MVRIAKAAVKSTPPIIKTLKDLFLPSTAPTKTKRAPGGKITTFSRHTQTRRVQWRREIISEQLCDDVLRYLAPTLDQYKGTSIIDINPGSCVWSRKLHEYLQPRCHLLMEPDESYYKPFIEPLLRQSGSKYTYTSLAGMHRESYWSNYGPVLDSPALLPPRPPLPEDDPKLRQLDTSLLVVGNLWRRDKLQSYREVSLPNLILQHMSNAALSNDIFQRAGLVRMLWWLPEERVTEVLPANTTIASAFSSFLDMGTNIVQIAGHSSHEQMLAETKHHKTGPPGLTHVTSPRVHEMTAKLKAQQAIDRPAIVPTWQDNCSPIIGKNPLETTCTDFAQLRQLIEEFRERVDVVTNRIAREHTRMKAEVVEKIEESIIFRQSIPAVRRARWATYLLGSAAREMKVISCVDLSMQNLHLEAELMGLLERHPDHPESAEVTQLVRVAGEHWENMLVKQVPTQVAELMERSFEHLRMAYVEPPAVTRDARPFNPLKVEEDEVWPEGKIALLMVTPKERDMAIPGIATRRQGVASYRSFVQRLFISRSLPLPRALDHIGPGAASYLIPKVPALADARRGGRLDPMQLKPRTLTAEQLADLATEFYEWPFKPSPIDMLLAAEDSSDTEKSAGEAEEDGQGAEEKEEREEREELVAVELWRLLRYSPGRCKLMQPLFTIFANHAELFETAPEKLRDTFVP